MRRREPLRLGPHWHVDCLIEAELPEDSIISPHFVTNVLFGSLALAMVLFTGWMGYKTLSLRKQVQHWERTIADNAIEVRDIQKLQREYVLEASRIDQAYASVRPALLISEFLAVLGRTLPTQINVDAVELTDSGVVVRGNLRESSQRASRILGDYVSLLRKDEKMDPHFREILVTDQVRAKGNEDLVNFEIAFRFRPLPPL